MGLESTVTYSRPSSGSRRTRSQIAPDWTAQESLILVNEIDAVQGDCLDALSSFQKWKIIVENCNALEVHRSLNQCKSKWDSLLSDYNKVKQWRGPQPRLESHLDLGLDDEQRKQLGLPDDFDAEVFKAIDNHLESRDGPSGTEIDSDPEAIKPDNDDSLNLITESGLVNLGFRVPLLNPAQLNMGFYFYPIPAPDAPDLY